MRLKTGRILNAQSEIVPGISLIRGAFTPGHQPDGNTVVLSAPDGLIVIDTGRHRCKERMRGRLNRRRALTDSPAEKEFARNLMNYYVDVLTPARTEIAPLCGG